MTELKDTQTDAPSLVKYQWTQGDRMGKVETVNTEDEEFTYFEGGARVYTHLLGEVMAKVGPNGELLISEDINEDNTSTQLTEPKEPKQETQQHTDSPVMVLLKKMKNPDNRNVNVSININLPSEHMFSILKDSFEDELEAEFKDFIFDQIDTAKIKAAVHESIKNILDEYIS